MNKISLTSNMTFCLINGKVGVLEIVAKYEEHSTDKLAAVG